MSEQKINRINISCLEVSDNKEQNKGGKFISILCKYHGEESPKPGQVVLLPSGHRFSLRSVEKEGNNEFIAVLKGIHRKELKRGNLIVSTDYAISTGKEAFFLLPSSKERFEKGSFYVEGGVLPDYNSRNHKPSASIAFHGRVASVRFFYNFPLIPGARYYISSEENRDLRVPVTLVYKSSLNQKDSALLADRLLKFGGRPSLKAIYSIMLRLNKHVELPFYMSEEEFEGSVRSGAWAVMSREYDRIKGAILKRSSAFGGETEDVLIEKISGHIPLVKQIINELLSNGSLIRKDSYLINKTKEAKSSLSPIASKLLNDLDQDDEGIRLSTISNPLFAQTYRALGRLDLVKILQGEIIISTKIYESLKNSLLENYEVGNQFDLTSAKENLNVGRRLLIPLLEDLDECGYFEWEGETRVVLKKD